MRISLKALRKSLFRFFFLLIMRKKQIRQMELLNPLLRRKKHTSVSGSWHCKCTKSASLWLNKDKPHTKDAEEKHCRMLTEKHYENGNALLKKCQRHNNFRHTGRVRCNLILIKDKADLILFQLKHGKILLFRFRALGDPVIS